MKILNPEFLWHSAGAVALVVVLVGCAGQREAQPEATETVDFAGSWELDYSRSDNIQGRLNSLVRELQRQAERRAQSDPDSRGGGGVRIGNVDSSNSGPSIIGLAQMAELITQSQLLEIEQGEYDIEVKREENFALSCEFHPGSPRTVVNPLGTEKCGWGGHQLVFSLFLPEGLSIQHRFTLAPDGDSLQIATTVVSDRVSYPFTLNQVYNRFDPQSAGFRCKLTLTKGKVCTTASP